MGRPKKDGAYINCYIRKDIKERLESYCNDVGQTNTMAIERILEQFLNDYDKEQKTKTTDSGSVGFSLLKKMIDDANEGDEK